MAISIYKNVVALRPQNGSDAAATSASFAKQAGAGRPRETGGEASGVADDGDQADVRGYGEKLTKDLDTMRLSGSSLTIRDVDLADETAQLASVQISSQPGAAMLAQANSTPQAARGLLS